MAKATDDQAVKEELIPYCIPISKENQDDVPVTINGRTTLIKRGEQVMVKPEVYEVLKNMEKMDKLALDRMKALQEKEKELS